MRGLLPADATKAHPATRRTNVLRVAKGLGASGSHYNTIACTYERDTITALTSHAGLTTPEASGEVFA
jgi:hypothetical protein